MKPAAQLQASIELLDELAAHRYPADRTMAQYFKQRRYIGSKDKAAISEYLYTVLRNRLSFEYLLDRADLGIHSRMLAALMKKIDGEDLREYFDGDKYCPVRLRPEQLEAFESLDTDLSTAPVHVRLNVPQWIAARLEAALGDRYEAEMQASNQRAQTDIRVNTLKCSVAQLSEALESSGHHFSPSSLSPWGVRFESRVALFGLDSFKQGWFEVQDEGSQLLALMSGVKAGHKVIDFCAGAGGKTLALAAMMDNKGVIYACDVHSKRLEQLSKRTKRAGAHNVRTHILSSENDKWVKQHKQIADVVLLDAPCTGTGTWRRSPDSRWNLTEENLSNLVELQQSIMQSAQRLVKPGGRLLYATCSLLEEENEQQVERFLVNNEQFEKADLVIPEKWNKQLEQVVINSNQLRTYPGLSGTDGFYVAALQRKPD
ncbi:MAG: 16S rRNA (cytosine967-C5)-methyltransferase [Cryomorphaceae bacterium]|jgi:16S rRNA (cytosine967-C5)-methyltransferase